MARILFSAVMALLASAAFAAEQLSFEAALRGAGVTAEELTHLSDAALWNRDRNAVAVALRRSERSLVLVLLLQPDGEFRVVDVSAVESGNLGKLGTERSGYDRYETQPVEWLPRENGLFQVVFRTRAWRSGQRYTASEALIIRPDGTPIWR